MTRLAGLVSAVPPLDRDAKVAQMLAALIRGAGAGSVHHDQAMSLGSGGLRANAISERHDTMAVVDGRIYNAADLSDATEPAEVLLDCVERHGFRQALERLNGDYAIAFWNIRQNTMWLARDRFGVKPLYYHTGREGFAFASHPAGLLTLPWVRREPTSQFVALFAASHYRYFDNDPQASPFADIRQLPAGHWLKFSDGTLDIGRYWQLEEAPDWERAEDELAEEYRELLLDAVGLRLRSATRPAFTLSGGMDSSSVLACAVKSSGKQDAFSTVYSDATYDESEDIQDMLEQTVHQWHRISVDEPDVFGLVREMVQIHCEPVATATWLSHYLLCHGAAAQGFEGLFGGLAGDELNAGEFEHFLYFFADLKRAMEERRLDEEISKWIEYHDHPIFRKSYDLVARQFQKLVDLNEAGRCRPDSARMLRYQDTLNPDYFQLDQFEPVLDHPFTSYLKNRTYQDLMRETIPCCLRAEDRQGTAFGLDGFHPFLDHRLVEFMYRVPSSVKYKSGVTKHLLRQAMRGILPEATRTRVAKTGWNAPAHVWFTGSGLVQVHDLVSSQRFRERGFYNLPSVEQLLDDHREIIAGNLQRENHMMFLWQLVNLELWFRECVDRQPDSLPLPAAVESTAE